MRITLKVRYEVSGRPKHVLGGPEEFIDHYLRGPLRTGLDAANAQLEAENKKLQLKLIDCEVE